MYRLSTSLTSTCGRLTRPSCVVENAVRAFGVSTPSSNNSTIQLEPLTQDALSKFPPIVFVLGGPGSGKGTQCELLLKSNETGLNTGGKGTPSLQLHHLNVGGLLRAELKLYREQLAEGSKDITPFGSILTEQLSTGKVLPSWVTISLMRKELERITSLGEAKAESDNATETAVMVDGFPRSVENFLEFERLLFPASRLIVIECDEKTLIDRVCARGAKEGRQDDLDVNAIKNRLRVFQSETQDVIRHFEPLDVNNLPHPDAIPLRSVVKVDGSRSITEVFRDFQHAFKTLLQVQRRPARAVVSK